MSAAKKDFFAKEVADAIKMACESLDSPQENLEIEVVETGSNGIFGLIRKKAHIRVRVKVVDAEVSVKKPEVEKPVKEIVQRTEKKKIPEVKVESSPLPPKKKSTPLKPAKPAEPVQEESAEVVRTELSEVLTLMGFPSIVNAEVDGVTVRCQVSDEHEAALTGQDGKIIDSLQYLLRKLVARKVEGKIRLSIDIGQYRERRKIELRERAQELAVMVKEDGKTQAIPPLNPSERRIVHVALQDDKDIRSRSVGGGLFKKILIYKPGKGKKPGGNKRGGRGKGKGGNGNKKGKEKTASDE